MMWALAIKSKLTAALLLGVVLVIVILTNFSERNSSNKINMAVASIYKDRLVVEGYIFSYAQSLRQIEEIAEDATVPAKEKTTLITNRLQEIKKLDVLYYGTKLTDDEKKYLDSFIKNCKTIEVIALNGNFSEIESTTSAARDLLNNLSSIQMSEAKLQMENVSKLSSISNLVSQFEMVVLIVIAIIVQILIFSSKAIVNIKAPDNIHLN